MKNLCIRLAKTEWSKLCGTDYNEKVLKSFKTYNECQRYLDGVEEAEQFVQEKHSITRGQESVQLIISDNIRNYYTEYFWWISTED